MPRQLKNPKKDRYVAVNVTAEDLAYARKRDQWNCAIVRAIQRQLPDAKFVKANQETIALTLPDDYRYTWQSPQEAIDNIIKPFDTDQQVVPFSFQLVNPISAEPCKHLNREQSQKRRFGQRQKSRPIQIRTGSASVRNYQRFREDEVS